MKVDARDLLTLSTLPGIGSTRLIKLISHFNDSRLIFSATAKDLAAVQGMEKKTALRVVNCLRDSGADQARRFVDDQLSRLNKASARIVTFWDEEYPFHLKHIYDPPAFLFVRGELHESEKHAIALVGTRAASAYGMQMAEKFARGFASFGITTVSGLARGIDTVAHTATLKEHGRTVAVLGSGVDVVYPSENRELAERIVKHGALISEFPMGTKPDATNFPRRNRIISGISLGTVIVETGIEGGAMLTASLAFDQNREVFAIPNNVNDRRPSGTHYLIKHEKATLVEHVEDVIETMATQLKEILKSAQKVQTKPLPPLSMFEQKLVDAMNETPIHIDALAERTGYTTADALVHLLSLEFKGVVKQRPGKMFVRLA
jgi:DNA processing protein